MQGFFDPLLALRAWAITPLRTACSRIIMGHPELCLTVERSVSMCPRKMIALLAILALAFLTFHGRLQSGGKNGIVPADAKLEKIFDGGVVLTEGVAIAPDNMVYF